RCAMYRRRRHAREIQFSFDSFLDVVANVCGIIIRLILVTWVGARTYHAALAHNALVDAPQPAQTAAGPAADQQIKIEDPLEQELQRHRDELEKEQQRLLLQLRQYQQVQTLTSKDVEHLRALATTEA